MTLLDAKSFMHASGDSFPDDYAGRIRVLCKLIVWKHIKKLSSLSFSLKTKCLQLKIGDINMTRHHICDEKQGFWRC